MELINDIEPKKTIIFCRTKKDSYHIHKLIKNMGVRSVVINGDMSQNQRDRSMNSFKQTRTKIIVATDLLSRGIHVENVDYIINYNVPKNRDSYFHRIGRTARIGNTGKAITIIAGRETREFHELKRKISSLIKNFEGNVTYENQIPLEEAKSNSRNRGEGYGGGRSRSFSRNRGESDGGNSNKFKKIDYDKKKSHDNRWKSKDNKYSTNKNRKKRY